MPRATAAAKPLMIPVTRRALMQRVIRGLRTQGQQIRADHRDSPPTYFLIDVAKRRVTAVGLTLEAVARDLDCMEPWEQVID
jgi:hypothetical protein